MRDSRHFLDLLAVVTILLALPGILIDLHMRRALRL